MISYISLGVAVVCFGKGKGVFGKTWFLPGAFSLAAALLDPGLRCYLTEWPWYDILYFYSETAALIFAGFWLKNDPSLKPAGNDAGQEWSPYAIDRNVST